MADGAHGGTYLCQILSNTTGQRLHLQMIGLDGTILNPGAPVSCAAPNGGTCSTPAVGLQGNLKFLRLVATQLGAPVTATAHYVIAVLRQQ